ncbi:MAG: vWA domain-containing protein [Myxococcales bacterium]
MRRTLALFALAFASLAAAAVAVLLRPAVPKPSPPPPVPPAAFAASGMRLGALLDRVYLPENRDGIAYLQINLAAAPAPASEQRVPVNAVLILDRSGSMSGVKIVRARDASRALVQALGPEDRLAIVEFSSTASVLVESTAMTPAARSRALEAIQAIEPMGGTNMSAAFELAAPQLARGAAQGRVNKVFLASDGQANEGVSDRGALLRLARRTLAGATLSTFGIGDDYDEDLMSTLAAQTGGRARYIDSPEILPGAFRAELNRASSLVAHDVRIRVAGLSGASVQGVLGFEPEAGWVRLPDFAAGEERNVFVKLTLPAGKGVLELASVDLAFQAANGASRHARAVARGTFTSDAALLALPPTEAAPAGAKAEMAQLADQAARLQESGDRREARARLGALNRVAARAAQVVPASSGEMKDVADEYERDVAAIDAAGGMASKKLKQRAFDALRAPVAGW